MTQLSSRRDQAQASYEAGAALVASGAFDAAERAFKDAVRLDPGHAEAHLGLATAHQSLGRWREAESAARAALAADPGFARAAHYLGALLVELDRPAEALPFLQTAADLAPEVAQHNRDLGVTQLFLGDLEGARARLLKTLELDVHAHEVLYTLIRMRPMDDGSPEAARLLEIATELAEQEGAAPDAERAQALFALAKARDDRSECAEAARILVRANALKRRGVRFDIGAAEARLQRLADVFDAALLEKLAGQGDPSERPIFIVGMPRSGSTLVEQILASHPDVHGGGEMFLLPSLLATSSGLGGAPYPEWAASMNGLDCAGVGRAYLDRAPTGEPARPRTTDKWLDNFEHLGLISVCLPNARLIHCQRDPRDQLLSCWSLLFSQHQEYAYDPDELVRYHQAYVRLMAHWRRVLPAGRLLDVDYEALVAEPEMHARRILAHCGLGWDDRVMRFWESSRPVKSASMVQVREPIYERSIGRWRPYAEHIPELFAGLPSIEMPPPSG